jgi:hypothetical protein
VLSHDDRRAASRPGASPHPGRIARDVAAEVRRWLLSLSDDDASGSLYRQIALDQADRALGDAHPQASRAALPPPAALIESDREELLVLLAAAADPSAPEGPSSADSTDVLRLLGMSYARSGDPQAVAAVLRVMGQASDGDPVATMLWQYLRDQLQPDGSPGLVSGELRALGGDPGAVMPRLELAMSVLDAAVAASAAP